MPPQTATQPAQSPTTKPTTPHPPNNYQPTAYNPLQNIQQHSRLNHWGDLIPTIHDNNHVMRILFQNTNGLSLADEGAHIESTLHDILQYQPHVIALAETNTNWSRKRARQLLHKYSQPILNNIQWATSSATTDTTSKSLHLMGGTATAVHGPMATHILETTSDPHQLGRWNRILLKGRTKNLAIYTAYRCTTGSIKTATAGSCFFREWHNIRRRGITNPNPRQQFFDDLQLEIDNDTNNDNEILLMMDANEPLAPNSTTNRFLAKNDLLPIHEMKHGYSTPPTHIRGSQKIDHIAGTINILNLVQTATILPIDATPNADHRALLIDIHLTDWLRRPTHNVTSFSRRLLLSKHAKSTNRYRKILRQQYQEHNIFQRIDRMKNLAQSHRGRFTDSMHNEAENLDRTITECKLYAERKACSRIPRRPFSPTLLKLQRIYQFYRAATTQLITGKSRTTRLQALTKQLGTDTPHMPSSIDEAKNQQKLAKANLTNAKKAAPLLRQHFLKENAAAYSTTSDDKHIAKILARMQRVEQSIADYKTIKQFLHKTPKSSGLTQVIVTDNLDKQSTITDKNELVKTIINRNQQHYSQAKETPLGHGRWKEVIGDDGTNTACDQILQGDLSSFEGAPTALTTLLSEITAATNTTIDDDYPFDEFLNGIKKWPEKTSTSAVGLHLGHLKALLPRHPGDTEDLDLLRVSHNMISLAIQRELPYHRWKQQLEIMLEKDPGSPKLERLRIIVLYEADLNLLMKYFWAKKMVWKAHNEGLLGEAQGGSRPHKTATEIAAKKVHTYLYSRLTATPLGTFDNDAKSCYDRIILPLAMLCCRSLGMPKNLCRLIANSLNKCIRRVKTANGISEEWYESTDDLPSFGSGQGSGGSPSKWLSTSIKLLNALGFTSSSMLLINPNRRRTSQRTSDSFVDDTTNGTNVSLLDNISTIGDLLESLQQQAQQWERLLFASGGRLELKKCFFYIISYAVNKHGACSINNNPNNHTLSLTCGNNPDPINITQLNPNKAHKTLGTMIAPTGCMIAETERIKIKATTIALAIKTASAPTHLKWKAYCTSYRPATEYSLALTHMSETEIKTAFSQPTCAILQSLGITASFPRKVAFAPHQLSGLGLTNPWIAQGAAKINQIQDHILRETELGTIILICFDVAQLIAGTDIAIFEDWTTPHEHLDDPYIKELRLFLSKFRIKLTIPNLYRPTLKSSTDDFLTNLINDYTSSPTERRCLQACRVYTKTETLSDLLDDQQRSIKYIYYHQLSRDCYSSHLLWPKWDQVPTKTWKRWQRFIRVKLLGTRSGHITSLQICPTNPPLTTYPPQSANTSNELWHAQFTTTSTTQHRIGQPPPQWLTSHLSVNINLRTRSFSAIFYSRQDRQDYITSGTIPAILLQLNNRLGPVLLHTLLHHLPAQSTNDSFSLSFHPPAFHGYFQRLERANKLTPRIAQGKDCWPFHALKECRRTHTFNTSIFKEPPTTMPTPPQTSVSTTTHNLCSRSTVCPYLPITISIDNEPITFNTKQTLIKHCSSKDFELFLNTKHNTITNYYSTVAWEFTQALTSTLTLRQRIRWSKWTHDRLPTHSRLATYSYVDNNTCPSCRSECEDDGHIVRCSHQSRQTITDNLITELHSIGTKYPLFDDITKGILTWIQECLNIPTTFHHLPTDINNAIITQRNLPPMSIFKGRISTAFLTAAETRSTLPKHFGDKRKWITATIKCIHQHFEAHWNQRNSNKHDSTEQQSSWALDELRHKATTLFHRRHNLSIDDHPMLSTPIETILAYNFDHLQRWVLEMEKTIPLCEANFQQRMQHRDIRSYF